MFAEYKKFVLAAYDQKKVDGVLSPELTEPTPGNLKAECRTVCEEGLDKQGERLLRSFIGQKEDVAAYRTALKNDTADKFRPLSNFLKKRSIQTDERNIELLAWLIGFEPRPYAIWLKNFGLSPGDIVDGGRVEKPVTPKPGATVITGPKKNKERVKPAVRNALIVLLLLTLTGGAAYWIWLAPPPPVVQKQASAIVPGKYMYWAGDSYREVPRNQLHSDTPVVPLDTVKLAYFKKITDWRTLSKSSIRKVWYAKVNSKIEIFTTGGFHPVDTGRRLLPLSGYIFGKYILPNR